jgi:peptidyl-prolyl cis-trans isomerase C
MRRARLLAAVAVSATLGACRCGGPPATGQEVPRPVAVVNGEPIAAQALARELAQARAGEGDGAPGAIKRRVLDEAVDRVLLLQAARARAIAAPDERVQRALLAVRAEYPGSHFDDLLAQERLSQPELVARLRDQLTIEKLFADEVFPRVQVTDAELEQYYAEHAAEFEQPEQVHAFQIVVRTKEEAQRAREEARRRPQAFAEVARKASIAPEGRLGGDLGWFGKGSGMPEVFDVCFKLPLNAISEVTPSPYGFHVFRVVARRGAARRPFAEARPVIEERLVREKRARAQDEYLAAARARAKVEIDEKALEALAP